MVQRITPSRPGQLQLASRMLQAEPLDWFDGNLYSPT